MIPQTSDKAYELWTCGCRFVGVKHFCIIIIFCPVFGVSDQCI